MQNPSRRERKELSRHLKNFAFENSPMFQQDHSQLIEVIQTHEFVDRVPKECVDRVGFEKEYTAITLGFNAVRLVFDDDFSSRPAYSYTTWTLGKTSMHPRDLQLSDVSWDQLARECSIDSSSESYTPEEILDGMEERDRAEAKDEILEALIEGGAECEQYQKTTHHFSTADEAIDADYERGVLINGAAYDEVSTFQTAEDFGNWVMYKTPADGELWIPPRPVAVHSLDNLETVADEIETSNQFFTLIRGSKLDQEAAEYDLLPHIDKLHAMQYVVECLKNGIIIQMTDRTS